MAKEAKTLAIGWGFWLLMGVRAAPHRYSADFLDMAILIVFGLYSLVVAAMTVRFLYRLVTFRARATQPRPPASQHARKVSEQG
ncbi:hypothetical protein ACFZCG_23790 [Streptomyces tanashiensis]|uniref:hypothetical protein n=1 Tax=Streptomyces tanashiensis TaxID=67367 RepID=UPI0036E3C773